LRQYLGNHSKKQFVFLNRKQKRQRMKEDFEATTKKHSKTDILRKEGMKYKAD
jgi:hypothetical protein